MLFFGSDVADDYEIAEEESNHCEKILNHRFNNMIYICIFFFAESLSIEVVHSKQDNEIISYNNIGSEKQTFFDLLTRNKSFCGNLNIILFCRHRYTLHLNYF